MFELDLQHRQPQRLVELEIIHAIQHHVETIPDIIGVEVTGLPTHAWACYSGWTNQDTLKNNCDLGGFYVIPAYAHLYE